MKRKVARLRLSPNEEAQLLRDEHERRRKLRIQQVREQERFISLQIRREVQRRREREISSLAEELRQSWTLQQRDKLSALQTLYQESLRMLGQAHASAKENEPDWEAKAQKQEESHARAAERYHSALKQLQTQRQREQQEHDRLIQSRKKAMQVEKERAARVSSLPPPPPNPIENIQVKKQTVKKSDVDAFSVTHYHMPETAVDREAGTAQPSARHAAAEEEQRLQDLTKEEAAERQEQLEKARLRGGHALRREQLSQDRQRLLVELEHLQQTDLLRRRRVVSQMPAQIFQPLHQRRELRAERQRDMEFAFEDMYTGERRVKGDLVLQLVPEPLPAMSTGSQDQELDQELDLTLDEVPPGDQEGRDDDTGQEQEPALTQVEAPPPPEGAPRHALKRLLHRIRTQRDQWSSQSDRQPPAYGQTSEAAGQDMTIDSGSLTSEEERRRPITSPMLPTAAQSPPPALDSSEECVVAGSVLPAERQAGPVHALRAERRTTEEALERQKQEQLVLLAELEEQRSALERLLQEARQEREELQTAVDQQDPAAGTGQEAPVQDQELTSVTPPPAAEPATSTGEDEHEDEHTCRIRQYQQRLLEQNRLHKQSVQEARQRLEEYQRILRTRYNSTTTATLAPPGTTNPILIPSLATFGAIPPAVPIQLPFGSATPLRLPVALSINSRTQDPVELRTQDPVELRTQDPVELRTQDPVELRTQYPVEMRTMDPVGLRSQDPVEMPPRDWATLTQPSMFPGPGSRYQRPHDRAWLTDSIMDRVSAHLPEGLRPPWTGADPLSYGPPPVPAGTAPLPAPSSTAPSERPDTPPEEASAQPGTVLPWGAQSGQPCWGEMERRRRELTEAQRSVQEQREELEEELREQRRSQEQREELEEELREQRRSQETQQPDPEEDGEGVTGPEGVASMGGVARREGVSADCLTLMSALLRAFQDSSVEASHSPDGLQPLTNDAASESDLPESPAPLAPRHAPPHPPKPRPRARPVVRETVMTGWHELSAIEEVDTPTNASLLTAPEEGVARSSAHHRPHDRAGPADSIMDRVSAPLPEGLRPPWPGADPLSYGPPPVPAGPGEGVSRGAPERGAPERGTPSSSLSSGGEPSAGRETGSDTGSSKLSWRERLRLEAGLSPPGPGSSALPEQPSYSSTDSVRGGISGRGPAMTSFRPPSELETVSLQSATRPSEPDGLSSTTISSGSYTTTNPENSSTNPEHSYTQSRDAGKDVSPLSAGSGASGGGGRGGAWLRSPSSSSCEEGVSALGHAHDSSIQRIIDKYTRELSCSMSRAGDTTAEGPALVDPDSSLTLQPRWTHPPSPPSDRGPEPARTDQEWDDGLNQILARLSEQSSSLAHSQGRDSTLDRMIGRLLDRSTCAGADQRRDSNMQRLIGHPSAQSSSLGGDLELYSAPRRTIGPLSFADQTPPGWDSTLSRTNVWPDEGRMRPLAAELDESAAQHSGSSGADGSLHPAWGPQRASIPASVRSGPARSPEAQPQSPSPGLEPQYRTPPPPRRPQQPDTSGVDPASESFHPLLAEVTHNDTAEPSMTFHLPGEDEPSMTFHLPGEDEPSMTFHLPEEDEHSGPDGSSQSSPVGGFSLTATSEEEPPGEEPPGGDLGRREDPWESSAASPERLRTEELPRSPPALQDSLYQLTSPQRHAHDSALVLPLTAEEAGLAALSLSGLQLGERASALDPPLEEDDAPEHDGRAVSVHHSRAETHGRLFTHSKDSPPMWERIMEAGSEKGILEESQLTLVSLTDTTLQDQELACTEEQETLQDQELACTEEQETLQDQELASTEEDVMKKEFETLPEEETSLPEEETTLPEEETTLQKEMPPSHAVMLLEFQSRPGASLQEAFQQKRRALIQRSARRVEHVKATRAEARDQSISWTSTRTQSITTQPKREPKTSEPGSVRGDDRPEKSQPKPQPPPPGAEVRLKKVGEVRICTPEQRRQDVCEMHQRTQRLYSRLEEVKHHRETRSRQELYAKNREKAKEFHKKTLQKLRAKKPPQ